MTRHEQTFEQHAEGNLATMIDQVDSYATLEDARDTYHQNTVDSMIEDGYSKEAAFDCGNYFLHLFKLRYGK